MSTKIEVDDGKSRSQVTETTRKLIEITRANFTDLLEQVFRTAESAFKDASFSSPYPAEQSAFTEAAAELSMLKIGLKNKFLKGIAEGLISNFFRAKSIQKNSNTDSDFSMENLSLVDKSQTDENAIVVGIVTNARSKCRTDMHEFMGRISVWVGTPIEKQNNPLDPEALFELFRDSLGDTRADLRRRTMLFEIFSREFLFELVPVLKQLNSELASRGIEKPKKEVKQERRPSKVKRQHEASDVKSDQERALPQGAVARATQQDRIDHPPPSFQSEEANFSADSREVEEPFSGWRESALSNYISKNYPGLVKRAAELAAESKRPISSGAGPVSYVTPDQLDTMLAEIHKGQQAKLDNQSMESSLALQKEFSLKEALETQIAKQLPEDKANTVGQNDSNTIYLISMLFDFILDDPNLPECVKVLLARLRIPVVKVALKDRTLLTQSSHVVRKLLNKLAYAGATLSEDTSIKRDPVYLKIEMIIRKIVFESNGSAKVFEAAYNEFVPYIENVRERAKRIEKRTAEAAKGRARLISIKRRAEDAVGDKMEAFKYEIPDYLQLFLIREWSALLVRIGLKQSIGGKNWVVAEQAIETMMWSQHPTRAPYTQAQWPQLFNQLKSVVCNGIKEASNIGRIDEKFLKKLEEGYKKALFADSEHQGRVTPNKASFVRPVETDNPSSSAASKTVKKRVGKSASKSARKSVTNTENQSANKAATKSVAKLKGNPSKKRELINESGEWKESQRLVEDPSKDEDKLCKHSREVDEFKEGDWFKIFTPGSSHSINGKLVEHFEQYGMFLFVNGRGQILLEIDRNELVYLLAEGRVMRMQGGQLIERGFSAILEACKGSSIVDILKKGEVKQGVS